MHHQVTYQVVSKMEMMMCPTKFQRGKKEKKGKGKADNNKCATISFNYSSMLMTNHDRRSFINVPTGKLPYFNGLTLPSGSTS
jgi:hypothetical protein